MESLLLGQFPKPCGLSRGSRNWGGDFSKDCIPTQGLWFRRWSIYEGYPMKCRLTNVPERNRFHGGQHKKWIVNAASGQPLESEPDNYDSNSILNSVKSAVNAFYRFSRPHTVIGTALSIVSVSLLAVEKITDFSPIFFTGVLEAVVAAFFMNIYIVGLNQLSDIDIDKVNKPYLPLASGEYSVRTSALIVSTFSILSFIVSWIVGSWPLFWAIFLSFVLGTAYSINVETDKGIDVILSDGAHFYELCSETITFKALESGLFALPLPLPMLRWKRFAVVAAMCILAVRAVIVQLAFFLHIQTHVFQRPAVFSRPLIFATAFMSFFSVVIALFKDIPDIEGDKTFGIRSFTVRLGQKRVFWICITLLEMAYAVAILFGSFSSNLWCKATTVIGHLVLALLLWVRAGSLDFESKAAITSFYMFIWQLFYAEYLLIPLVR